MEPTTNDKTKKAVVVIVSVLLLVALFYFFFIRDIAPQEILIDEFGNPIEAQVVGQDLIDLLAELDQVTLDGSIFRDQAFVALTDFSVNLNEEPKGRLNPFSSI